MTVPVSIRDVVPPDLPRPTISVIIPALNEARNLPHVAAKIPADIDEIVFSIVQQQVHHRIL